MGRAAARLCGVAEMRGLRALACAGVIGGAALAPAEAMAASTEEQQANCAEAAQRYVEVYGKSPKDEPLAIVMMYKHTFCPPALTVKQGSKVRFVNVDKRTSHSFWFRDDGRPESERFFGGESVEMLVDLPPGEHTYLCGPHWQQEGMVGRMRVVP